MSSWCRCEIAEKIEYEGGIFDAIIGYGLPSGVLPADAPQEVRTAWVNLQVSAEAWKNTISKYLNDDGDECECGGANRYDD